MVLLLSFRGIEEIPSVQEKQLAGTKKGNQFINQLAISKPGKKL